MSDACDYLKPGKDVFKNMENLNNQTDSKMSKQPGRERLTVLIVDKKQINNVLEQDILSFGNRVIIAECYRYAIQAATNTRNDLITISMNLPDRDGIQMISDIKKVVGAYNIVSTDTDDSRTLRKEKEKQILYYIKKPLEVNDIKSILEQVSRKKVFCASTPN